MSRIRPPDSSARCVGVCAADLDNGFDVASQGDDVRESISLTAQFAAVDEILTGRENLVLMAKLRHLASPRRVADEQLDRFSLADFGGRNVATYSDGMRRRLDIAMSLVA